MTIDIWDLSFRDLLNLVHAYIVKLTPESVSMSQALEGESEVSETDVVASLTGDEPADVAAARAVNPDRSISIQEALAAGGFDLLDELRAQMEAGTAGQIG